MLGHVQRSGEVACVPNSRRSAVRGDSSKCGLRWTAFLILGLIIATLVGCNVEVGEEPDAHDQAVARYNLANAMLARDEPGWDREMASARKLAEALVARDARDQTAYYLLGLIGYASGKTLDNADERKHELYLDAAARLEFARQQGVGSEEPYLCLVLADIHRFFGYNYNGIAVLTEGLADHPDHTTIRARLGRHEIILGEEITAGFVPHEEDRAAYLAMGLRDRSSAEFVADGRANIRAALHRAPADPYVVEVARRHGLQ